MGSLGCQIITTNGDDPASSVWALRSMLASGNAVASVNAGSNITITGTPTAPIVNAIQTGVSSITAASGTYGSGVGGIFIGGTSSAATVANTGILSVTAGTGIATGGTAANPTISNAGVLSVASGVGITTGGTAANPFLVNAGTVSVAITGGTQISAYNLAGGASTLTIPSNFVTSVTAGTGIATGGTAANPTIANTGTVSVAVAGGTQISVSNVAGGTSTLTTPTNLVTSVTAGTGIIVGGTSAAPTVTNNGVVSLATTGGTQITVANVAGGASTITTPANLVTSVTAGTGIIVGGTSAAPTVTNNGVTSLTSGTGITLGGTSTAPTISLNSNIGVIQSPTYAPSPVAQGGNFVSNQGQQYHSLVVSAGTYIFNVQVQMFTPSASMTYSNIFCVLYDATNGANLALLQPSPPFNPATGTVYGPTAGTSFILNYSGVQTFTANATIQSMVYFYWTAGTAPRCPTTSEAAGSCYLKAIRVI